MSPHAPPVTYRHTQRGLWALLLCLVGVGVALVGWWVEEPPLLVVLTVLGATLLLVALCFHSLTVADEGDRLAIRFGPLPLFQKHIRYDSIQAAEVGRTTVLDGWGVHMSLRGGWVWNIWGRGCVVVRHTGGTTRIGTDDPENLAAFLRARAGIDTSKEEPPRVGG